MCAHTYAPVMQDQLVTYVSVIGSHKAPLPREMLILVPVRLLGYAAGWLRLDSAFIGFTASPAAAARQSFLQVQLFQPSCEHTKARLIVLSLGVCCQSAQPTSLTSSLLAW